MEVDLKKLRNNVKSYISTKLEDSTYSSEIEEALYESSINRTSLHEIKIHKYQIFKQRYTYDLGWFILNKNYLLEKLNNKEITVTDIFNKNQIELFPEKWKTSQHVKEQEEKFLYETHLVSNSKTAECFKCKTINVYVRGQQSRSADEPETIFYLCLTCGNRWKK